LTSGALRGRFALVTGASSGIGRAIARALAAEAAALRLVGRDGDRLAVAQREALEAGASEAEIVRADLASDAGLEEIVASARRLAPLDILVHSAGAYERGAVERGSAHAFDRQYRANLRAPFVITQGVLPLLRERGGDIVFVNSTQGLAASAGLGQFAATQHGLKALADSLRQEVNADDIRVLTVHLGRTATPRQQKIFAAESRSYQPERLMQPEEVAAMVVAALRLPRSAEVTSLVMRPTLKTY
jgi:NADP-dependent 3-hydroxy acid dehydrogenase YdfG